jgi:hypothetical protein
VGRAAVAHSNAGNGGPVRVEEVPAWAATASVLSVHFDPKVVLPPDDPMTPPLLRLMVATDDVRFAQRLFVETSERHRAAPPESVQQRLLSGEQWYGMRLLCASLHEALDAVRTLNGTVGPGSIRRVLRNQPEASRSAFENVMGIATADQREREQTFVYKVRNWITAHYQNQDVERVYRSHAGEPVYIEGLVIASEVGGLGRYVLTDELITSLLLDAARADLPARVRTQAEADQVRAAIASAWKAAADEVLPLADGITTFVDALVTALVLERGHERTERDRIEIPTLLRAAGETEAAGRARESNGP